MHVTCETGQQLWCTKSRFVWALLLSSFIKPEFLSHALHGISSQCEALKICSNPRYSPMYVQVRVQSGFDKVECNLSLEQKGNTLTFFFFLVQSRHQYWFKNNEDTGFLQTSNISVTCPNKHTICCPDHAGTLEFLCVYYVFYSLLNCKGFVAYIMLLR